MPKYVIEREIPGAGDMTEVAVQAVSQTSCGVVKEISLQITATIVSAVGSVLERTTVEG